MVKVPMRELKGREKNRTKKGALWDSACRGIETVICGMDRYEENYCRGMRIW